jgi:hypothetical protein
VSTKPEDAWQDFRRRKRLFWILFLLYLPVTVLISLTLRSLGFPDLPAIAAAIFWLLAWLLAAEWLSRFRCPSCAQSFFGKRGIGHVWSNTCRHCGTRPQVIS